MKRSVLTLILVFIAVSAYAGCATNKQTAAFTDIQALSALNNIALLTGPTSPQAQKLAKRHLDDGVMAIIPKNTAVKLIEKTFAFEDTSLVEINGVRVIILGEDITCD